MNQLLLFFVLIPVFLEGCCVGKHHDESADLVLPTEIRHFKVVQGDTFKLKCKNNVGKSTERVVWYRYGDGDVGEMSANTASHKEENRRFVSKENVLTFPTTEAKHSGNYSCSTGGRELFLHLQVLEKDNLGCRQESDETGVTLTLGKGGIISCPAFNCNDQLPSSTHVTWYKGSRSISQWKSRDICVQSSQLFLCKVYETDTDIYFCDRRISEQGLLWTKRRAVVVTAIPQDTMDSPTIRLPYGNETEEVYIGKPHNLTCEVKFGYERNFSPLVKWYSSSHGLTDNNTLVNMESTIISKWSSTEFLVTHTAVIQEVTSLHLDRTYTCVASNAVGNNTATVTLKRRTGVEWLRIIVYTMVPLFLVAGLGIVVRVKWLELFLLYKYLWPHTNKANNKEFDVFLSYVWSPVSVEVQNLDSFSPTGPESYAGEEGHVDHSSLVVQLTQVIEDQWGYRLYLMERDLLPGGAYTEDVVNALKRSRMLICLLSAEYLSNSPAVFVLESGLQALLQGDHLKILLVWAKTKPVSLVQLEPPLPMLVQRALKVLPTLNWFRSKPGKDRRRFWRSLRKAMPVQGIVVPCTFPSEIS